MARQVLKQVRRFGGFFAVFKVDRDQSSSLEVFRLGPDGRPTESVFKTEFDPANLAEIQVDGTRKQLWVTHFISSGARFHRVDLVKRQLVDERLLAKMLNRWVVDDGTIVVETFGNDLMRADDEGEFRECGTAEREGDITMLLRRNKLVLGMPGEIAVLEAQSASGEFIPREFPALDEQIGFNEEPVMVGTFGEDRFWALGKKGAVTFDTKCGSWIEIPPPPRRSFEMLTWAQGSFASNGEVILARFGKELWLCTKRRQWKRLLVQAGILDADLTTRDKVAVAFATRIQVVSI